MSLTSYTPRTASQDSVFDMGSLADLKSQARADSKGSAQQKKIATQFEALFLQMMLKRMREATPNDSLFDSDQSRMIQSMADEQLALQLASPGVGLAKALIGQMNQGAPMPVSSSDLSALSAGMTQDSMSRATSLGVGRNLGGVNIASSQSASGEVNALLNVMRSNRASDRVMAAAEGAPEHVVNFVSRMSKAVNTAAQQSGVPARLIMGQAALESGWGQREIKHEDGRTSYNLFGIKAGSSWQGKVVNVMTTEFEGGQAKKMVQPFRAYSSYEESFADYANLIGNNPRYAEVTRSANEYDAARKIQAAGYATDPSYADKLISIMRQLRNNVASVSFSSRR